MITVSAQESYGALQEPVEAVVAAVKEILEMTPPELSADIIDHGIVMTGGGALLDGLDTLLSHETKLSINVATDAISCVALGTGKALASLNIIPGIKSSAQRMGA